MGDQYNPKKLDVDITVPQDLDISILRFARLFYEQLFLTVPKYLFCVVMENNLMRQSFLKQLQRYFIFSFIFNLHLTIKITGP